MQTWQRRQQRSGRGKPRPEPCTPTDLPTAPASTPFCWNLHHLLDRLTITAAGRTVPDVLAPNLRVLFCGINPGLYSGVTGHHFARPGNRFWPALHAAGFTPRRLQPHEEQELLALGYGITNLVERATARADELTADELASGGKRLAEKIARFRPQWLAVLGSSAYRVAFGQPKAVIGRQPQGLHATRLWVLPNPSGLNAHYAPADLARAFAELRAAIED